MKKIIIAHWLIPCCFFLMFSCKTETKLEEKSEVPVSENLTTLNDAQMKNSGIVLGKIEQRQISSTLKVNGKIDVPPQNMVSISVPLGGYLKSMKLLEGMFVKKGQEIATVEDQQYIQLQQDYLTAKAQFGTFEKEFERQKELNQSKSSSDKVLEQAKTTYLTQNILIKSLEEKLKLVGINPEALDVNKISKSINIYSPISGFVSKINVNMGKYISPTDVLFELVNPSDIHLALTIFEKDVNKLFVGQSVIAYTNTNPEKKYPCKIILIGKDLSENRSVEVHCHFANFDKTLLPGMFMNAEIDIQSKNAITLPSDAIVNFENKHFIFIENDKKAFEMKEISIGNTQNKFTEIKSDVDLSNKNIVIKGAYNLLMKMKNTEE